MGRGVLIGWLLVSLMLLPARALAASDVQLKYAPDGTIVVIGTGWRRDQELVVNLGGQRFAVRTDASGDFELATGLASYRGELNVQHATAMPELAFVSLPPPAPNPLAVVLAWSVVEGCALLGILGGVWLLAAGVRRRWRSGRYPR